MPVDEFFGRSAGSLVRDEGQAQEVAALPTKNGGRR